MILYVAQKCETSHYFGAIKLNKIIWKADFDSFAARGVPVTGREYRREKYGPVPKEMVPLHTEMLKQGAVRIVRTEFGKDETGKPIIEHRTVAQDEPNMSLFTPEDVSFVDKSISHYWEKSGTESSDESHGVAWRTRSNGDPMPYELAWLSDQPLGRVQAERLTALIVERNTNTL
jgi:hypothetical protein